MPCGGIAAASGITQTKFCRVKLNFNASVAWWTSD